MIPTIANDPAAAPPGRSAERAPYRVLIVDDEPGVLLMLKMALTRYGFVTEGARDGREAMDKLSQCAFDVVVSDVNMPGYGGMDFLRGVHERGLDVPVILMAGRPNVESSARAMEYGAFRYLSKPVLPATLKEVIERAVRLHEIAKLKGRALELLGADAKWLDNRAELEATFGRTLAGLQMAFQPIVSWSNRCVIGHEALLRSSDPTLGNPGAILDAAAKLGRLHELGRAVRAGAARHPPPDGAWLFVNLHSADLNDEELYSLDTPLGRLAHRVVLEITERASLEDVADLEKRVARLRHMGYRIAVDDLGAGYAGLTSFNQLAPEVAKIDMSLIRDIHLQPRKQAIVRSLQTLCSELGILVVVEGVETALERATLTELGCDVLQGYLFARPGKPFPEVSWQ